LPPSVSLTVVGSINLDLVARCERLPQPGETVTDASFERCADFLIENWRHLRPALATHNVRSAARAQALAHAHGLPPNTIEFQALYGMGDAIARALTAQGERVRVYVPFGELLPGMAYLVRRLLENSSNDSFVRQATTPNQMIHARIRT